jgi:pilus assembly protein CpaE
MPGPERIKVIVVDDIAETREMIQRMLLFDPNIEVVATAQSGREAIDLTLKLKPDVIIMDINMPDMDGITATDTIRKRSPYTQVIILSVQSDAGYMRKAMLAGARDFLAKPPSIDDLTHAIRTAGTLAQEQRAKGPVDDGRVALPNPPGSTSQGKIIAIYSPKGGSGCTTVATNLAVALTSETVKVALIDANLLFGDVAVFLNIQGKNTVLDLISRVEELDEDIVRDVMVTHPATGISILAAPSHPELTESVSEDSFSKLLTYMRRVYDYIIVDCTPYLTNSVRGTISVADLIILLVTQDIPSVKNANLFLGLADASGIKRYSILFTMNRFDKRISISPERIGETLKQEILVTIPFDERTVSNAITRGIPFVLDNRGAPVSKSILNLADLVRDRVAKFETGIVETPVRGKY